MTYHCKGCFFPIYSFTHEYCVPCEKAKKETPVTHEEQFPNCPFCYANKKETPVIDDSNCHCGPCTAMNEPLTLEGDIRYLKAHIETKDRQLAEKDNALYDAEFRIRIYRDAVIDAENENNRLREENEKLRQRSTEQNDWLVRLQQENKKLREEIDLLNTHKARYQEEILALEGTIEDYAGVVQRLRDILRVAHEQVELFVKG